MIENKNMQSGRSMIEMLGVLAIIGVLSVGGIAGYSKAMMKFKVNKTVDQITQIATNVRTLFGGQRDYERLTDKVIIKGLLVPDEMMKASASADDVSAAGTYKNPYYENAWGFPVLIEGKKPKVADGDNKAFMITFYDIPVEACLELAVMDWGSSSGSGLVAFGVGEKDPGVGKATTVDCLKNTATNAQNGNAGGFVCANATAQAGRVPMNPADAAINCSTTNDGAVNLFWKFY